MIISLICFVARELLSSTNLAPHISFVCGICIFIVAIMPLVSSIEKIGELSFDDLGGGERAEEEYESIFESYVENAQIDLIKSEIRDAVCEKFGLDPSEVKIYVKYNSQSETRLERVSVSLLGSAVFANSNEITSYLEAWLGCEVVVTVG